jgi:P27 family predicted phage terminase small subunit
LWEIGILNGKSPPPKTLKASGKRLWKDLLSGWDIQLEQFVLLQALCESQDRISELSETLRREGRVVADRFGQLRPHPATLILKGENGSFARLFKLLALEPPSGLGDGPGRPAGFMPELK